MLVYMEFIYLNTQTLRDELKPTPGDRSGQICKLLGKSLALIFAITFMGWSKCFCFRS